MNRRIRSLWLSLYICMGMTPFINLEAVAKIGSSLCPVSEHARMYSPTKLT